MEDLTWTTQVAGYQGNKANGKQACLTSVHLPDSGKIAASRLAVGHSAGMTFQSVAFKLKFR